MSLRGVDVAPGGNDHNLATSHSFWSFCRVGVVEHLFGETKFVAASRERKLRVGGGRVSVRTVYQSSVPYQLAR
jgi:hypothetical protein